MPSGPDSDDLIFGMGAELVVSRTVRDTAAVLDATHGADVGARLMLPSPEASYRELMKRPPGQLRIAYASRAPTERWRCTASAAPGWSARRSCCGLGHIVEEASPVFDHQGACLNFLDLAAAFFGGGIGVIQQLTGRVQPGKHGGHDTGHLRVRAGAQRFELGAAFARINGLSRVMGAFFTQYDLWLTPTMAVPPSSSA